MSDRNFLHFTAKSGATLTNEKQYKYIPWTTISFTTDSRASTVTSSNTQFTIPTRGIYLFNLKMAGLDSTGYFILRLETYNADGSTGPYTISVRNKTFDAFEDIGINFSRCLRLDAGMTFKVAVLTDDAVNPVDADIFEIDVTRLHRLP
jgi:hypothetical protein